MIKKNKHMIGICISVSTLFLMLTISPTQGILNNTLMIDPPSTFAADINPNHFSVGMPMYDSISLEFSILSDFPIYSQGDRMNYTLIDNQQDEIVFDEIIYTPFGAIHQEGNYTVQKSDFRIPLFMTTSNVTLIDSLFSTHPDWNYTYQENFLIFRQTAYNYPELGDITYSEYVYDGITGWLMSLHQKGTAANDSVLSEVMLNVVGFVLPPIPTTTEDPTTNVETTEPSSDTTIVESSTLEDSTTTTDSETPPPGSTTTTTIPEISSFFGFLETLGVITVALVIYRRKR